MSVCAVPVSGMCGNRIPLAATVDMRAVFGSLPCPILFDLTKPKALSQSRFACRSVSFM